MGKELRIGVTEPASGAPAFAVSRDSAGILIGVRDNAAPQFAVSRDSQGLMLSAWPITRAMVWRKVYPDGVGTGFVNDLRAWTDVAISNSGDVMMACSGIAGAYDGGGHVGVYFSLDGGGIWTKVAAIAALASPVPYSVCCSADGSVMGALVNYGVNPYPFSLFLSTNSGADWAETTLPCRGPTGTMFPKARCSPDGETFVMVARQQDSPYSFRAYVSTNGGSGFSEVRPAGVDTGYAWDIPCVGTDGLMLLSRPGALYGSGDYGSSWTLLSQAGRPAADDTLDHIVIDPAASAGGEWLRYSNDHGDRWNPIAGTHVTSWPMFCFSRDGAHLFGALGIGSSSDFFICPASESEVLSADYITIDGETPGEVGQRYYMALAANGGGTRLLCASRFQTLGETHGDIMVAS